MTCFDTGFSVLFDIKTWESWTPILSLLVAIGALCTAYHQVQVGRNATATALAHNIYQQYLVLCMENADLASGQYRPSLNPDKRYAEYTWFFSNMLFAFEQILEAKPKDKKWKATIKSQLEKHKFHIQKSSTANSEHWFDDLSDLIKEVKES
ncbi:hypothetical protein [Shewanella algae]|uniref:hypothetical protein n=1 Tax=Shewanella algae TaxID=38313 RepID=UPI0031F5BBBA